MRSSSALPFWFGVGLPLLLVGSGCGSVSSGTGSDGTVGTSKAALRRMQSCEELTQALRDDALSKMNQRIDAQIRAVRAGYVTYGTLGIAEDSAGRGVAVAMTGAGTKAAAQAPNAQATDSASTATPAHSETETQVKGVDEADIVKADGTRLYVLHGQKFLIVDAWPASALALENGVDIEGEPTEMFVANGKAVVFSTADGAPIYAAAGVTPRSTYSDGYATRVYTGVADVGYSSGGAISSAYPLTKVTVLNLDGGQASVARELYFEGSYLSSRRVDHNVRLVLEGGAHGPVLDYSSAYSSSPSQGTSTDQQVAAWEEVRAKNQAAIQATSYEDWVAAGFEKTAGGMQTAPAGCGDYYVPTTGSTEFGMTQIVAFDLAAPSQPARSVSIVGAAQTVYGNASSMVLAGRAYTDPWVWQQYYALQRGASAAADAGASQTLNYTYLHLFDVTSDAGQPTYLASGKVPGDVKDQFGLDEKAGQVRVTTTEQRTGTLPDGRQNEVSHVYVLQNREHTLSVVGDAGEIAPGEQLYATRYVGDKAYVVTWHVTDPLFVIDLADPIHPKVLGQLQIPGFSEYMHPLDDTHLLTIGRETDDTGHQHTDGGYWYGIAIQVFDVTDPLKPTLAWKYVYDGGEYATSEATQNHKAFTYFDDRKLLAFPYVRQAGWGASASTGPSSTLEIFRVDVPSGIQKIGSVDHSSLLPYANGMYGYCGGYYDGAIRRGVFFENFVYSISYGGIMANDVADLSKTVATLKLDAPAVQGTFCGK